MADSPAKLNITISQGTVWRRKLIFSTGSSVDAPRIDLTGCQIEAQVREAWNKDLTKQFTVTIDNPTEGEVTIELDDTDRSMEAKTHYWDMLVTFADDEPRKYLEGAVCVKKTITRIL